MRVCLLNASYKFVEKQNEVKRILTQVKTIVIDRKNNTFELTYSKKNDLIVPTNITKQIEVAVLSGRATLIELLIYFTSQDTSTWERLG